MSKEELSDECFENFRGIIHKITGITIDVNRRSMLVGRIKKRVQELQLKSYESYLNYLSDHREEEVVFTNLITTNETYCYRTPRVWDFFEQEFLPGLIERKSKQARIWSAASSTGEEAHTIGVFCESFKSKERNFTYKITGTDISESVVEKARQGLYVGRSVKRFRESKPDLFSNYMEGSDDEGFKVVSSIKRNIQFHTHNLFKPMNQKFDIIFLRNVLIYFNKEDQEKVLSNMYASLAPEGYLIIGESESLNRINTDFESVAPLIYRPLERKKEEDAA